MPDGGLFPPDGGTSIPDGILADKIFALIRPDLVLALQGTYPGRGGLVSRTGEPPFLGLSSPCLVLSAGLRSRTL